LIKETYNNRTIEKGKWKRILKYQNKYYVQLFYPRIISVTNPFIQLYNETKTPTKYLDKQEVKDNPKFKSLIIYFLKNNNEWFRERYDSMSSLYWSNLYFMTLSMLINQ
jgi:hypothetical protein